MSSWDEYPLAGRLRVEEPVGVFRLLEREAMGEKALERELAACNETRAFFLADSAERPRGVDRELPPEHVLADVERRLVAFAHEADAPPGRGAAHGGDARVRVARAVHRRLDALAVGQRAERGVPSRRARACSARSPGGGGPSGARRSAPRPRSRRVPGTRRRRTARGPR